MTTKTAINLSPIKRCHGSAHLKKRRLSSSTFILNRKPPTNFSLSMQSLPTIITITCEKQISLPDLVHDIHLEQRRRETIVHIANTLRKVGDQIDEQLQINNTSSIDHIFRQRTMTFAHCLSRALGFFL